MKIITQIVLGIIFEAMFGVVGLILGVFLSANTYDYSIGNAVGWEGGGVYFGIAGICLGGLCGMFIANKFYKDKFKKVYFYVLALLMFFLWIVLYSFLGSLPLLLVVIFTTIIFSLLNNLSFVRK